MPQGLSALEPEQPAHDSTAPGPEVQVVVDEDVGLPVGPQFWGGILPREPTFFERPLYEHLRSRNYHSLTLFGEFHARQLMEDCSDALLRSEILTGRSQEEHIHRLLLRFGEQVFVTLDDNGVTAYAPTAASALEHIQKLRAYLRSKPTTNPCFYLLNIRPEGVDVEPAEIVRSYTDDDLELVLHYGDDFTELERQWLDRFCNRSSGISVFTGPPGVGKTSFVRRLLAKLAKTHRFYFVPTTQAAVLSDPTFVSFWVRQSKHCRLRKVVILEDAESLLWKRDEASGGKVSNLLNLGDGLLGEFAQLQILATANCALHELDPALTRPGRLIGWREFRRLQRWEAERLATYMGLTLSDQPDYSLAEIYNSPVCVPGVGERRTIGFGG